MTESKPLLIALAVVGALIIGVLAYVFTTRDSDLNQVATQPIAIPALTAPEPEAEPEPESEPILGYEEPSSSLTEVVVADEPAVPAFVLPLLDDSDQLVRDGVVSLTRHEGINRWLGPSELIRKCVVFVDNVSNGSIPRSQVGFLAPESPFVATPLSEGVFLIDEKSYQRYNVFTDILVSIESRRAAEFYHLMSPLFQKAYGELGYPGGKFDDVIFKAIGRLLETPVINEPVRLVQPVVIYEFEDPRLESLSAAQKQLIRMGPRNTQAIQAKLSEVALELRAILKE